MRAFTFAAVVCGIHALSGITLHAAVESHGGVPVCAESSRQQPADQESSRVEASAHSVLRVSNVRLDAPSAEVSRPAALLKFDLLNDGELRVTDVRVEITIFERSRSNTWPRRIVAGPVTIRGHATIEAGYTVSYEMLLRNLASDCDCDPHVSIVSARPIPIP
jgi:hypothetical protein